MTAKIVNGREIALSIKKKLQHEVNRLQSKYDCKPMLATVIVGEDPSSEIYLKLRDKACKEIGINTSYFRFKKNISEKKLIDEINVLNNNSKIHGILVQYPLPNHISQNNLMSSIHPDKDVEGFNPCNMGKTLLGNESILPCTPSSVLTILEHEKEILKGRDITIINHSNVVGKPLAAMLLNRDATVTICHVFTKNLIDFTSKADILISAVGKPKLITCKYIQEKSFVIDVGIAQTKEGICGDVDFDSVKEKARKITPVPGGVGPVTITSSIQNTIKLYKISFREV